MNAETKQCLIEIAEEYQAALATADDLEQQVKVQRARLSELSTAYETALERTYAVRRRLLLVLEGSDERVATS